MPFSFRPNKKKLFFTYSTHQRRKDDRAGKNSMFYEQLAELRYECRPPEKKQNFRTKTDEACSNVQLNLSRSAPVSPEWG